METDVLVIGGGVIGSAIARELSRYNIDITLVEKESDVARGTSKANSGIIHAGYNANKKTVKGCLNVKSNPLFDEICNDLKVPFKRIGSLVVGFTKEDLTKLKEEKHNGTKMGVEGLEILSGNKLFKIEPELNKEAKYALYAPTAGIISPYMLTIAYADNAVINGVNVMLETEVIGIIENEGYIRGVKTNRGNIKTKIVINAAGLYADKIANMAHDNIKIKARKGEYYLYDKGYGNTVNHVLFPIPTKTSKGILVTPTVHDNLLIGPNSYFIDDKEDKSTTKTGLKEVVEGARKLIPDLPEKDVITSFSGLRAAASGEDFIIGYLNSIKGFINVAGIQSPGLSSTPAIANKVKELVERYIKDENLKIDFNYKDDFKECLKEYPHYNNYKNKKEEWQEKIEKNQDYAKIICRCESVTRGEIIDAINRPVKARTVDAVKRRTRAGMGRCQGGFCGPRVVELIAEELGISPLEVTKKGGNSKILFTRAKELIDTGDKAGEKE